MWGPYVIIFFHIKKYNQVRSCFIDLITRSIYVKSKRKFERYQLWKIVNSKNSYFVQPPRGWHLSMHWHGAWPYFWRWFCSRRFSPARSTVPTKFLLAGQWKVMNQTTTKFHWLAKFFTAQSGPNQDPNQAKPLLRVGKSTSIPSLLSLALPKPILELLYGGEVGTSSLEKGEQDEGGKHFADWPQRARRNKRNGRVGAFPDTHGR